MARRKFLTNDSKKRKGTFARVIDAFVAWEIASANLEREVLLVRDELRASPALNKAGGRLLNLNPKE
jgi:hypothetical protein